MIDYTDFRAVRRASEEAEKERERLFRWTQISEFRGDDSQSVEIRGKIMSKCRSLGRIRDHLRHLADKLEMEEKDSAERCEKLGGAS